MLDDRRILRTFITNLSVVGRLLVASVVVAACADQPVEPPASDPLPPANDNLTQYHPPQDAHSRWDAPWWSMGDAELADSVEAAGGRVFIGFKEPGAVGGVDDRGQVLVSPPTAAAGMDSLRGLGVDIVRELIFLPAVVAVIEPEMVPVLRRIPLIDQLEPILPGEWVAQTTTWNVEQVDAPDAWAASTGSGVDLLIIDSGIDTGHVDLDPDVVQACDGSDGVDQLGHGTHVAGIAAAVDNTTDVVGVAHGVSLWTSKVGTFAPDADYIECAVQFARVNDLFAMNMSVSVASSPTLTDEIKGAYDEGHFLVAAAGNTNGGSVVYPAELAEVVAVTAVDSQNNQPSFAAVGDEIELSAPGVDVPSTCLGGGTCLKSGTSMASPHVAAAAAVLKGYESSWTNSEIRTRLQQTATDLGSSGRDDDFGYGLLQVQEALQLPPLTVSISGPTKIKPDATCTWESSVSNGSGPFTYEWKNDGFPVSDSASYTGGELAGSTDDAFPLRLEVMDANGAEGSDDIFVEEDPNAFECII